MSTKKHGATKDRLLLVAQAQFSTVGYQGATVESITKAVGVHPSALYKHYVSKWDLFVMVIDRLTVPLLIALRAPNVPSKISEAATPELFRIMLLTSMAGGKEAQLIVDKLIKPLRRLNFSDAMLVDLYRAAADAAIGALTASDVDWGDAEWDTAA